MNGKKIIEQCIEVSKLAEEYGVVRCIENACPLEKWIGIGKREPKVNFILLKKF